MQIRSVKQVKNLAGKKALLRADFNVPIINGKILDEYKIKQQLPTIRFLLKHKCKIIIITHLGRPFKNEKMKMQNAKCIEIKKQYTVKPIAVRLSKLLRKKVKFVDDSAGFKAGTAVSKMKKGEIIMLENLRFHHGELSDNKNFARSLAKLADIYVNDAFAVSHRAQASVSAIKNYLPAYAGLLMEKEINNLNKVLRPQKPLIVLIGGVKISTKLPLIKNLSKKAEKILVGGALANNFLAAHGYEVGKSIVDKQEIKIAKTINKKKIILPIDAIVEPGRGRNKRIKAKKIDNIQKYDKIYDIGPETIKLYVHFLKKAKTIIWNGPLGMFEVRNFKYGTLCLARVIAARSAGPAFGVAGGGETAAALKMTKMFDYVDWVSTGGGAMLSFLGGAKMPGLEGIVK